MELESSNEHICTSNPHGHVLDIRVWGLWCQEEAALSLAVCQYLFNTA